MRNNEIDTHSYENVLISFENVLGYNEFGLHPYKYKYRTEPYVSTLKTKDRFELSKFQCAALIIAEVMEKITGVKETHYPLCGKNHSAVDEYHFLLVCAELQSFVQLDDQLDQLMNLTSTVRLTHLSMYCKIVTALSAVNLKFQFCTPYGVTNMT